MFNMKAWRKANKPKRAAHHRVWVHKLRESIIRKLGGKCSNPACQWLNADGSRGCTDVRCLQVDHVFNDGSKERKEFTQIALWNKILADTDGRYQLLCANCNWIKRAIYRSQNAVNW